ncbi:MAG: Fic family protein [Candidatus Lambdaproteobacteria bacterium]|nr:Fic family protein [Candidatus Lambdaproteobacteria bacterium]
MIRYSIPPRWIGYDGQAIMGALANAKATLLSLQTIPYQKQWVERLQALELKREVEGTSRIEGADFTEHELDAALSGPPDRLVTRSQRQARAAVETYRWIATLPDDRPVDGTLVREIHRRMVTGADDDHCPPGVLRKQDDNVTFGQPRHRGAEGGEEVNRAFALLIAAIQHEFRGHDPIVQAMAAHYHVAAMHPFLDGNGRTARALEALLLQRAGLRHTAFVAMSNYYYDEKPGYLKAPADTRAQGHDLTPFLLFALKGVAVQGGRLLAEIRHEMQKEVFRNLMFRLFTSMKTKRQRVIGERQIKILNLLLDSGPMAWDAVWKMTRGEYAQLQFPAEAAVRDLVNLEALGAVKRDHLEGWDFRVEVRLEWPTEITETEFFERLKKLPKGKTYPFLR